MYTHPDAMFVLSAEIRDGLIEDAARHRLLKAARHARRGRHARSFSHRLRHRTS
jgi:hypothetical protein